MENDPCKFALTSRTGDMVETFILHSSSPSVRQTWIHEINQILENQRNFLNGDVSSYRLCRLLSLTYKFLFLSTHYISVQQSLLSTFGLIICGGCRMVLVAVRIRSSHSAFSVCSSESTFTFYYA